MDTNNKVYLYGASGHAKVVMDIARLAYFDVPCLIDDNPDINELAGLPVVHSADGLKTMIVTIGDCQIRRKIVQKLGEREFLTVIHPSAIKADSVKLGHGTVVMAGAILNPYTEVGNHCIINTGAIVEHDNKIADFAHISVGANLGGTVSIGRKTWVGIGSTLKNNVSIVDNVIIGAGAVVVKNIEEAGTYIGVPAQKII